jgi:hypothetical protein
MLENVREYIDKLHIDGHALGEDHDDDPVLVDASGRAVDTWRENYPYDERLDAETYDEQTYLLRVELLKSQSWTRTPVPSMFCSSKAATPPEREARSSGSWST